MQFDVEFRHCKTKMIFSKEEYEANGYLTCTKCDTVIEVSFFVHADKYF